MLAATEALDGAIARCERLRTLLKKTNTKQVRGADERGIAKATALAWFNSQAACAGLRWC